MSAAAGSVETMTTRQQPRTTLTARTPEDVLALVPVVLGFEPTESLVLLTFGAATPFHARVDLPDPGDDDQLEEVAATLLAPARLHRVRQVLLVGYSEHDRPAERTLRHVRRAFRKAGVAVIDALRTDGRRWYAVPPRAGVPDHGVPYDLAGHRFAAQAVLDGRVVRGSRAEVAATVATDREGVAGVVAALAALTGEAAPALEEGLWARELVVRRTRERSSPTDAEVARLLRGVLDVRVRDAAWSPLSRETALDHVDLWADVVRRAPDPLVPAPAALLAFAAWQAGDGALAWCAVDRAHEVDPAYSLAGLVAELLTQAVPPSTWEGGFDWTSGHAHD